MRGTRVPVMVIMSIWPEIDQFLKALDETQYLPPARMQAYQRRLLTRLLNHAHRETTFYAERLNPVMRADGSIDWDRWQELPILTRSQAQDNFTALCARSLPSAAIKLRGSPLPKMRTMFQESKRNHFMAKFTDLSTEITRLP